MYYNDQSDNHESVQSSQHIDDGRDGSGKLHRRKRSTQNTFNAHRSSNKTNMSMLADISKPVYYDGKEVTTAKDLLDNFKLDSFYECKEKLALDEDKPKEIDEKFLKMIQEARPGGHFFEHSVGDKMLYFKKIDRIRYDVVEAERMRKQQALEAELAKLRDEQGLNKKS